MSTHIPQVLLDMLGQSDTEIETGFEQPFCNNCNHTRHSHISPKYNMDGEREEGYCVVCECEEYDGA